MSVADEVKEAAKEFDVTDDQLKEYKQKLLDCIDKGLKKGSHDTAIVKAFVTYVQALPDGTEEGKFIGLDVGGSTFRVLLAELSGGSCKVEQKSYLIPPEKYTATKDVFFDLLAQYIAEALNEFGVAMDGLPVGLTFSFPLKQQGMKVGILERWTKKYNIDGVVGQDVVQLLNDAVSHRSDLKINLVAVLNDTTGTLISCAFDHPNCAIGMILGTGTNACYLENQKNAELFDEADQGSGQVIINTEWGAFGDDGMLDFIRLDYDKEIDKDSINPGQQLNEKLISAMYLGEITRLAIQKYMKQGIMLKKKCKCPFSKPLTFRARFVSAIEAENDGTYTECRKIMQELGVPTVSDDDCANVKYVCSKVSTRAAVLCAAGLAALVEKTEKKDLSIGIDGALYKMHPKVPDILNNKLKELVDPSINLEVFTADDGSGKGAALVAAVAKKEGKIQDLPPEPPAEAPPPPPAEEPESPPPAEQKKGPSEGGEEGEEGEEVADVE